MNVPAPRAMLTGATGFVGGALARALIAAGYAVTALGRPASRAAMPDLPGLTWKDADLFRPETLAGVVEPCSVFIHAASIRNRWGTPPAAYQAVNVDATRALLQSAAGQAQRFIYLSSVGVHRFGGNAPIQEDSPLISPWAQLDYHSSKLLAEQEVAGAAGRIETVVIRPTITYGPGDTNGMVTRLIRMIAARRHARVGSGRNHLHLTCIDDLLDGILSAAVHPDAAGQTFILCGPRPITMDELIGIIHRQLGMTRQSFWIPRSLAWLAGGMLESLYRLENRLDPAPHKKEPFLTRDKVNVVCAERSFSCALAAKIIGYSPRIDYDEGLSRTIGWSLAGQERQN